MNIPKTIQIHEVICPYCKNHITNETTDGMFHCTNHAIERVIFAVDHEGLHYRTFMMTKVEDQLYYIVLHRRTKEASFCKLLERGDYQNLLELDYLPQITPEEFPHFVQRILNNKAFL